MLPQGRDASRISLPPVPPRWDRTANSQAGGSLDSGQAAPLQPATQRIRVSLPFKLIILYRLSNLELAGLEAERPVQWGCEFPLWDVAVEVAFQSLSALQDDGTTAMKGVGPELALVGR